MKRHDRSDFEPWIDEEVIDGVTLGGPVNIDLSCGMPAKFHDLSHRNRKFRQAWERTRTDLKDTSMSGYDLSLAGIAVGDGWNDQEIVDLLIKFAQFHQAIVKDGRYYRYTIAKARKGMASDNVVPPERIQDFNKAISEVYGAQHIDEKQNAIDKLLVKVNEELGTSIVRVVRYPAVDPKIRPAFRIYWTAGMVHFANASELGNQSLFWAKLREQKILGGKPKKKGWDKIVEAIIASSDDEQTSEDDVCSDAIGRTLIRDYLQAFPPVEDASIAHEKNPFFKDDAVFFLSKELSKWAANSAMKWVEPQHLCMYLRDAGCGHKAIRHPRTKRTTKMWYINRVKYDLWEDAGTDADGDNHSSNGVHATPPIPNLPI